MISRWDMKINRPRAATRERVHRARGAAPTSMSKAQSLSASVHESRIRRARVERRTRRLVARLPRGLYHADSAAPLGIRYSKR